MPYMLAFACGCISALLWLYLLFARGGFWRVRRALIPPRSPRLGATRVAVIIPARDEAEVISKSLTSLFHQAGGGDVHIFVIDDASSDQTAQLARQTAQRAGTADSVSVIDGEPLPPGWSGKLWAVQQGIERARELRPQFFLLTDADIVHASDNLATLIAHAENGGYDLVSLMVKLHCATVPEKLLIPAFVFFFFKLYPPRWIAEPQRTTAAAAGGCILIRTEALERAGGIEVIRNEIIDDCALARRVKNSGGRTWLGLASSTVSIRGYGSFAEIGGMIARSAFSQLRHSTTMLLAALLGMTLVYVVPVALLFSGRFLPVALGAAAWVVMMICYMPMIRFYALNPLWALTLPLAAIFYMGATLKSALDYWFGRGGKWKGRVQDHAHSSASKHAAVTGAE